jgi:hypothetical protein
VPDYEINRKLWFDRHYEGGYLFRDTAIIELTPPQAPGGSWQVSHGWQSRTPLDAGKRLKAQTVGSDDKVEIAIPFDGNKTPGITGQVRFLVSPWNR